ncbi:MAG: extracellular solute-binding protein [Treponema sp.]|jgi:ABC-type glycerol-3-phosphate transport system substrate-binding protein|nr:extracellular solute-binding protein [Treponema sp.]
MKQRVYARAALAGALFLACCGSGPQAKKRLADTRVTILWHTSKAAYEEALRKNPNAFDAVWSVVPAFEKEYGGRVEVLVVDWGKQRDTLVSMVRHGDSCDLAEANDQNFPLYPLKGIVRPLEGLVNLNEAPWNPGVSAAFTWGDTVYGAGAEAAPFILCYNKTLFEARGQKTPQAYYAEGRWTWEAFRAAGIALTRRDQGLWGYGAHAADYQVFIAGNGAQAPLAEGLDASGFTRQGAVSAVAEAVAEAVAFLRAAYAEDRYADSGCWGDLSVSRFKEGKLAMTLARGLEGLEALKGDFEIGWAPPPRGPGAAEHSTHGVVKGWCIPVTAWNPKGAAAFMTLSAALARAHALETGARLAGPEDAAALDALSRRVRFSPIGLGDLSKCWDADWVVARGLREGTAAAEFLGVADRLIREGLAALREEHRREQEAWRLYGEARERETSWGRFLAKNARR